MTWKNTEQRYGQGPQGAYDETKRLMPYGFKLIAFLMVGFAALGALGGVLGWFSEAQTVAREEFGPRAMLEKYEWFKDMSAQIDKKQADIKVYQARVDEMRNGYKNEGIPRSKWDRVDKQQFSQWQAEVSGVIASYNALAADYNAQMAKFNWRFANRGELPQGAGEPLPREFKPYETR